MSTACGPGICDWGTTLKIVGLSVSVITFIIVIISYWKGSKKCQKRLDRLNKKKK